MTAAFSYAPRSSQRHLTTLIVGDCNAAVRRAERTLEDAGIRAAASLTVAGAIERLERQDSVDLLWVELDGNFDESLAGLLARVDADASVARYSVVVAAPTELIDPLSAAITCSAVELLINGSEVERAGAVALAGVDFAGGTVRETSADASAARLRQLSEEVSRIAAALAKLSNPPSVTPTSLGTQAPPSGDIPQIPADAVRSMIRARRLRSKFLPEDLFADPAWDMLLDLLQAEIVQHRVPVSSLCIAAAVPATTALRWLKTMTDRGLVLRRADPHDGRRIFIEMAPTTSRSLRQFFAEAGMALV